MFTLLSEKRFIAYLIGLFFDRLGNATFCVVLPLLIFNRTHSFIDLVLITLSKVAPKIFSFLFVGPMVDGCCRKKIFFIALVIQAVCSALIGYISLDSSNPTYYFYLLTLAMSLAFELSRSSERALVPMMFSKQVVNANSYLAMAFTISLVVGPVLTTLFINSNNYYIFLILNSITYLMPIVLDPWSKIPNKVSFNTTNSFRTIFHSLAEGLSYAKKSTELSILIIICFLIYLATGGIEVTALYILKNQFKLSDNIISMLFIFQGVGMFLSTAISFKLNNMKGIAPIQMSLCLTISSLFGMLFSNATMVIVSYSVLALSVFSCSLFFDIFIQKYIDQSFNGRVGSLIRLCSQLGTTVSLLLLPVLNNINASYGVLVFSFTIIFSILGITWFIKSKDFKSPQDLVSIE